MGKPNAIEQARRAILRAQHAVLRCRAAAERFRTVSAERRTDLERLRAGTGESIGRSKAAMAVSASRREDPIERAVLLSPDAAGPPAPD
ncbi:hypothetical protein JL101_018525 [Skermanella rosea]|uniref:hypothetical protein n=1 Tax=Skermanella rosea TaxID=1817965 RepID=UPI0019331269|nr:hypothetical protein [Skermanella rosea]UEM01989.1 hypothetical protein JL101_018525 [Skermanella rosea]